VRSIRSRTRANNAPRAPSRKKTPKANGMNFISTKSAARISRIPM
jgi:hypothetical protein